MQPRRKRQMPCSTFASTLDQSHGTSEDHEAPSVHENKMAAPTSSKPSAPSKATPSTEEKREEVPLKKSKGKYQSLFIVTL